MRRRRAGAGALLLLVLLGCAREERGAARPSNFGVVVAPSGGRGGLYRGAQPSAAQLAAMRRDLGIRTIVKLNVQERAAERAAAALAGIKVIEIPILPEKAGTKDPATRAAVERALAAFADPRNAPVYVHCQAGRDRTGYLVGLYRARVQGWAFPQISAELARHGHGRMMRRRFPAIARALAAEANARDAAPGRRAAPGHPSASQ